MQPHCRYAYKCQDAGLAASANTAQRDCKGSKRRGIAGALLNPSLNLEAKQQPAEPPRNGHASKHGGRGLAPQNN